MRNAGELPGAEKASTKRDERQQEAQASSRIGYWSYTPSAGTMLGSKELYRIFDINEHEASLDTYIEVVHPDDAQAFVRAIRRGAEFGESWDIRHRLVCRDGSLKWVRFVGEPIAEEENHVVQLTGTVQDITDIQVAESALRESELWMKSIYNSLDEAVLVVSPDRELINVNRAAEDIFGYSAEEIFNSSTELFHVDHQHYVEFGERIRQAFSKGQTAKFEFEAKRKNGEIFPTEHTVSLLRDQDGAVKGIVSVVKDITERKLAEQSLRDSEAMLREAQRIAKVGVWRFDLTTKDLAWSDEVYRIFEIDKETFSPSYEAFLEVIHPADRKMVDKAYSDSLLCRDSYEIEHRLLMRDGRIKYVQERCETLFDLDGSPLRSVGTVHDITERKQAEEELARVQGMLEQAIEVARMGAWAFDLQTNELIWSDITKEIHEVEPDYVPDIEAGIHFYKEGFCRDRIGRIVRDAMQNGGSWDEELLIVTAKGNEKWVRAIGQPEFKDGVCVRLYGSFQDISERKRAEEDFKRIFELSPDLVGTGNLQGYFTRVNSSFKRVLGFSNEEFMARPFLEFMHEDDIEGSMEALQRALAGTRNIKVDNRYICKDGSVKWIEWDVLAIVEENKFYATGRDITERKETEVELQKYRDELEEIVVERTRELRRSLAEKEVLLKEVHHRVKNNMAMISAFIHLQMPGVRESTAMDALRACENRIQAMSMVHKRLYQSDDFTSINMHVLLNEICGALYEKAGDKGVDLDVCVHGVSLEVDYAIPCAMIVNELVANSLKHAFTDGQKGKIDIHMNHDGDGAYRLRVSDNGKGIPASMGLQDAETLGLQLVNVFIDQLNGKPELSRSHGFSIEVEFSAEQATMVKNESAAIR